MGGALSALVHLLLLTMTPINRLIALRRQRAELEAQERALMEHAITYALSEFSETGQKTVEFDGGRVLLKFVTQKPKSKDYQDLETLVELIAIERDKAGQENREWIDLLKQRIESLQVELEAISITDEGRRLMAEYERVEHDLTCQVPQLAISFK